MWCRLLFHDDVLRHFLLLWCDAREHGRDHLLDGRRLLEADIALGFFALGQYVLRRTISMPNDSNFNFSDAGANQIFSTASILGLVMPPVIESVIGIISAPAFRADYFWGWLRKPSNYTTSGNNRVDVSTEWWLEQWSTILYSLG